MVVDVNLPDLDGIELTRHLRAELPATAVVLISVVDDAGHRRRGREAGAHSYLLKPFAGEELVAAVRAAHAPKPAGRPAAARRRPAADSTQELPQVAPRAARAPAPEAAVKPAPEAAVKPTPPADAVVSKAEPKPIPPPPPPVPVRARGRHEPGRVIVVFSGKGGVGKSVLAINLAASLGTESDQDVALVDLDLQFGDIAVLLGLDPVGTIADVPQSGRFDAPFLGELMPEAPGRLRVLSSPLAPELADLVRPEHVVGVLDNLKGAFDHVVVDLSQHLDDVTLAALERADRVILVTDMNIPAIKDAKLAFRLFSTLGVAGDRISLVLNRADAPSDITVEQIESNLQWKVAVRIPSEGKLVLQSIQKAVPAVLMEPDSEFALSVRELAGTLIPLADAGKEGGRRARRGLFSRRGGS